MNGLGRSRRVTLLVLGTAAGGALGPVCAVAQAASRVVLPAAHIRATVIAPGATPQPAAPGRAVPLRVRNPAAYARAKRAAWTAARPRGAARAPAATTPVPQASVLGTLNDPGLSAAQQISAFGESGDITPPDTTGAIGPTDYVEIVNGEVTVYDRTDLTPVTSPVSLESFTGGADPCDVQVKYDPQSDRWFYSALRCDGTILNNQLYVGWSKTNDPSNLNNGWCKFAVSSTPATLLDDYDKLGVDGQHVIIGSNGFDASSGVFQTAHILVAPKPPPGTLGACNAPSFSVFGSPAAPLLTTVGNLAFAPEPATISDSSSTVGYVVAADFDDSTSDQSGSHLMVWRVGGPANSPSLNTVADIGVNGFTIPPITGVPQPGTSDTIDPLDGRLTQAVAATDPQASGAEAIWTQHTVSDGGGGSEVRWYELVPSTLSVRQFGTITDSAGFAFNGGIAPTRNGGAVIDYDTGGSSQQVQLKAQSRGATDPLGTMSSPITLASSSAVDSDFSCPSQPWGRNNGSGLCRWGDYSGASVDPDNPDVVWGSNQVNGPTGNLLPQFGDQAQWLTQDFALTPTATPDPTAAFAISDDPASPGSSTTFDASASSDSTGITDYTWDFGDGSPTKHAGTSPRSSHIYLTSGIYTVTLTVTDGAGRTSTSAQTMTVDAPPSASFVAAPNPSTPGAPIGFDASGSSDPNPGGTIAVYGWNFGDGSHGAGLTATHSYGAPGIYSVTLTVTDDRGQTATQTQTVTVDRLLAAFTCTPNPSVPGGPVAFNATGSSDATGTITAYTWNFGDGSTATGATPSHAFGAPGSYLVTLTVANSNGQTATASNVVTVDAPPGPAFTITPNPGTAGSPVTFDATITTHPPGTSSGYMWAFGDGGTASGPVVSHSYASPGSYVVTLTVVDSDGQTATTTKQFSVGPPPLRGHLSIVRRQGVAAIRRHGLLVSLSANQGGKATFKIIARLAPGRAGGGAKSMTLLRGRRASVFSGRHRVTLKLKAGTSRTLGRAMSLVVRATVVDTFGQHLTLSATLRL